MNSIRCSVHGFVHGVCTYTASLHLSYTVYTVHRVSSNGNPTDSSASSSYGRLFYSKAHSEKSEGSHDSPNDTNSNSSDSESTEHSNDSGQFNRRRQGHETHHSLRLSAPRGLAQINLQEIEQIDHDLAKLKQTAHWNSHNDT